MNEKYRRKIAMEKDMVTMLIMFQFTSSHPGSNKNCWNRPWYSCEGCKNQSEHAYYCSHCYYNSSRFEQSLKWKLESKCGTVVWEHPSSFAPFRRTAPRKGPTNSKRCFSAKFPGVQWFCYNLTVVGPGTHLVKNHESQLEPKSPWVEKNKESLVGTLCNHADS